MKAVYVDAILRSGDMLYRVELINGNGDRDAYFFSERTIVDARDRVKEYCAEQSFNRASAITRLKSNYVRYCTEERKAGREALPVKEWLARRKTKFKNRSKETIMNVVVSFEEAALSLIKPFNVKSLSPQLHCADTGKWKQVYDYFRFVLSSEAQTMAESRGRKSLWVMTDKTSGAFLGLFSFCSSNLPWALFDKWLGGKVAGADAGGSTHRESEVHPTGMMVLQLSRCIPLYDFGKLTGGKMLALAAFSQEVIRTLELRYSQEFAVGMIITLHGKGSQYNRLHTDGIVYAGEERRKKKLPGRGLYVCEIRDNAKGALLETHKLGDFRIRPFAAQFSHWHSRWLPNKIDQTLDGMIYPDREDYRLSNKLHKYGYEQQNKGTGSERQDRASEEQ